MYGYFKDNANVVACAAALQDYIDKMFPGSDSGRSGRDSDVPEVSVSFSEFGAIIEASELQVWHSEQGQGDMTPENVIASFRARCDYWAVFGTHANSPVPPKPVAQPTPFQLDGASEPRKEAGLRLPLESHVLQAFVSEGVKPMMDQVIRIDRDSLILGYAGVYSSFLLFAQPVIDCPLPVSAKVEHRALAMPHGKVCEDHAAKALLSGGT
jgi:hypothetical protein